MRSQRHSFVRLLDAFDCCYTFRFLRVSHPILIQSIFKSVDSVTPLCVVLIVNTWKRSQRNSFVSSTHPIVASIFVSWVGWLIRLVLLDRCGMTSTAGWLGSLGTVLFVLHRVGQEPVDASLKRGWFWFVVVALPDTHRGGGDRSSRRPLIPGIGLDDDHDDRQ